MFIPEPNESNFVPPPAGSHVAICYRFVDLGTQENEYKGVSRMRRQILLSWELPTELMDDGRPFTITRKYTWSMSEKSNLRHDLEAWRGRAFTAGDFKGPQRFNVKNILGKACMLSIIHQERDGTTYANLQSVSALPKGLQVPDRKNEMTYIALERQIFDNAAFEKLSDKLKDTIRKSPEYDALMNPEAEREIELVDEEIPF